MARCWRSSSSGRSTSRITPRGARSRSSGSGLLGSGLAYLVFFRSSAAGAPPGRRWSRTCCRSYGIVLGALVRSELIDPRLDAGRSRSPPDGRAAPEPDGSPKSGPSSARADAISIAADDDRPAPCGSVLAEDADPTHRHPGLAERPCRARHVVDPGLRRRADRVEVEPVSPVSSSVTTTRRSSVRRTASRISRPIAAGMTKPSL